jgi:uncharacterized Fe-S radical SAM superfamily protein PflX
VVAALLESPARGKRKADNLLEGLKEEFIEAQRPLLEMLQTLINKVSSPTEVVYLDFNRQDEQEISKSCQFPYANKVSRSSRHATPASSSPSRTVLFASSKFCVFCQKPGHMEPECFIKNPQLYQQFKQKKLQQPLPTA